MRGLVLLVLALPLAGCFGECGPTLNASWMEPGLYDALPGGAQHAGFALHESALPAGLATHDAALAARWSRFALTSVAWRAGARNGSASVGVDGFSLTTRAGVDNDSVRLAAHDRLAELGVSPDAAWDAQLLASRASSLVQMTNGTTPVVVEETFRAPLPTPPDVDGLVARLGLTNALVQPAGTGSVVVRWTNWSLGLALPTRSVDIPTNGTTLRLEVDPSDHVTAVLPLAEAREWRNPLALATGAAWARMGLGAPKLEDLSGGVLVC